MAPALEETGTAAPADAGAIDRIMAEMPCYASEFEGTYANHAPMVLVALDRIGGDEARLRDFFESYRESKSLLPSATAQPPLEPATWESAIGDRAREPALRAFFDGEVARLGVEGALCTYLPFLAPGVAASAFHGLMRTAYALLRRDETETAIALSYWAATYLRLPAPTGAPPRFDDPAAVLAAVCELPALRELPLHPLLWQNMREVGAQPSFAPVVDWLVIGPDTPRLMATRAIELFAATQDFCALHAVTGMHWFSIVAPHCSNSDVMLRHFWQGIAALMGEMGFPSLPPDRTLESWRRLPSPGWPEIKAKAAQSYDEHDISLAFSASALDAAKPDPLYRLATARRLGMVTDYT